LTQLENQRTGDDGDVGIGFEKNAYSLYLSHK